MSNQLQKHQQHVTWLKEQWAILLCTLIVFSQDFYKFSCSFVKKSFLKSLSLFVERQMKENIFEDILPVACSFSFTFPTSVQCLVTREGWVGPGTGNQASSSAWSQGAAAAARQTPPGWPVLSLEGVRRHWASFSWDSDHVTSAKESLHSMTFA